jgi:hypothetical protein
MRNANLFTVSSGEMSMSARPNGADELILRMGILYQFAYLVPSKAIAFEPLLTS